MRAFRLWIFDILLRFRRSTLLQHDVGFSRGQGLEAKATERTLFDNRRESCEKVRAKGRGNARRE